MTERWSRGDFTDWKNQNILFSFICCQERQSSWSAAPPPSLHLLSYQFFFAHLFSFLFSFSTSETGEKKLINVAGRTAGCNQRENYCSFSCHYQQQSTAEPPGCLSTHSLQMHYDSTAICKEKMVSYCSLSPSKEKNSDNWTDFHEEKLQDLRQIQRATFWGNCCLQTDKYAILSRWLATWAAK